MTRFINFSICALGLLIGSYLFFEENYAKSSCFLLLAAIGLLFEIYYKVNEKAH